MTEFLTKYWMQEIFTVLIAAIAFILKKAYAKIKASEEEQKCIKKGLLAIAHDRLYQACRFFMDQGDITIDELSNLEYLFKGYKNLGGNGTVEELYGRIQKLKIVERNR